MSFNLASRLSNLAAQTEHTLSDLSHNQSAIVGIVNTPLPSKQALLIQSNVEAGALVISTDNNTRRVFSVYRLIRA